jgi:hypothetical protein
VPSSEQTGVEPEQRVVQLPQVLLDLRSASQPTFVFELQCA